MVARPFPRRPGHVASCGFTASSFCRAHRRSSLLVLVETSEHRRRVPAGPGRSSDRAVQLHGRSRRDISARPPRALFCSRMLGRLLSRRSAGMSETQGSRGLDLPRASVYRTQEPGQNPFTTSTDMLNRSDSGRLHRLPDQQVVWATEWQSPTAIRRGGRLCRCPITPYRQAPPSTNSFAVAIDDKERAHAIIF
jgi:hypothetical protein